MISTNENGIDGRKAELRREYLSRRKAVPADIRANHDTAIAERLTALNCFKTARTVLLYYPARAEIDTTAIALRCLREGKKIAYPLCRGGAGEMTFRLAADEYVGEDIAPETLASCFVGGAFGIPEPREDAPCADADGALIVLPALAFDRSGYRLGYGGGYYDRFLAKLRKTQCRAVAAGLAYDANVGPKGSLPRGEFDLAADMVITEKEMIIINQKA